MTVTSNATLTPETVNQLQELIQINIDSRDGFRKAADALEDLTLRSAFEQLADDRELQADELATCVAWSGDLPRRDGSFAAAVHRAWISVMELVSSDQRHAMLSEAERGEDQIKAAYEKALKNVPGAPMHSLLQRHYLAVKASHDRIRDLRDACAAE